MYTFSFTIHLGNSPTKFLKYTIYKVYMFQHISEDRKRQLYQLNKSKPTSFLFNYTIIFKWYAMFVFFQLNMN